MYSVVMVDLEGDYEVEKVVARKATRAEAEAEAAAWRADNRGRMIRFEVVRE